ncbi:hypothetical protein [Nicoliella lavandulae]|uniref:Anthranilate synthase component I N-terminal domain-containing protein n=1 Tax=Nicoliella lavandulae TaxID=3082954 RepID=A0ABU8SML6_9LACO
MKIKSQLKQYRHSYSYLPVSYTLSIHDFNAFKLIEHFDPQHKNSMLLTHQNGRMQTVVVNPKAIITARNGHVEVTKHHQRQLIDESPVTYLKQLVDQYRVPRIAQMPAFTTGLI